MTLPTSIKTVVVTVAKDVDLAATDVLKLLANVEKKSPAAVAALGVLLGALGKAVADTQSAAQNPAQVTSITFDQATFADLKAVWPDLVTFATTLGIKL